MTTTFGLIGFAGRMGQAIAAVIKEHPDTLLAGGLERAPLPPPLGTEAPFVTDKAEDLFPRCDALIDFSNAAAMADLAKLAVRFGKPFLSGTTGLDEAALTALREAGAAIPVLHTTNTSLSLIVVKRMAALAARLLKAEDYDIAIHDAHHKWKKDAPSGTALTLGRAIEDANDGAHKPAYSATRAGAIVGEHTLLFAGASGETISLRHTVTDRRVFAHGAVAAALWLVKQKAGFYQMDDVLGA